MPSFMRLGAWNIVMFVSYEQIKRLVARMSAYRDSPTIDAVALDQAVKAVNAPSKRYI